MQINFSLLAMPRLRSFGAGFLPRIPWLDPWSVHESLRVFWLFVVCVIPPLLYTHFHLNNTVIRRTKGRQMETFVQSNNLSRIASTLFFLHSPKGKETKNTAVTKPHDEEDISTLHILVPTELADIFKLCDPRRNWVRRILCVSVSFRSCSNLRLRVTESETHWMQLRCISQCLYRHNNVRFWTLTLST